MSVTVLYQWHYLNNSCKIGYSLSTDHVFNGTLIVSTAEKSDSGNYRCLAEGSFGATSSTSPVVVRVIGND